MRQFIKKEDSNPIVDKLHNAKIDLDILKGISISSDNRIENVAEENVLNKEVIKSLIEECKSKGGEYELFKPILRKYLQIAMLIEHSTIPPYLTAMYSIHDGKNQIANQIIRSVVVEEMLHMIMVCNVMNALDLKPSVNKQENYPSYPAKLPLNVAFFVNLEKFSHDSISSFIAIEKPDKPLVEAPISSRLFSLKKSETYVSYEESLEGLIEVLISIIDRYAQTLETIGQYYTFIEYLIDAFNEIFGTQIFNGVPSLQITPEEYYGSGGILVTVKNMDDVRKVFQEIKDQGEGAEIDEQSTMYDKDISQFGEGYELSHYYRFKEVLHEHFYIGGNYEPFKQEGTNLIPIITPPNGKPLDIDWTAVYPIKMNAKSEDYNDHPEILSQAKEFNKTYKRLMDAIQAAIEGDKEELPKSIMYMHALREQAVGLMKQPLDAQQNAAPTFEYINL